MFRLEKRSAARAAALLFFLGSALPALGQSKLDERLAAKARSRGAVRVLVRLKTDVPFRPESQLASRAALRRQRLAIASAQRRLRTRLSLQNASVQSEYRIIPYVALEVDEEALEELAEASEVAEIAEDLFLPPLLDTSMAVIGADLVWGQGVLGSGQAVAILDTGIQAGHSFLGGRVAWEGCYSTTSSFNSSVSLCPNGQSSMSGAGAASPAACSGVSGCDHGTHVAGIAAGSGSTFHGAARASDIIAVQVFSRFNDPGLCGGAPSCLLSYVSDQMSALQKVYDLRTSYNIASVNLSLGGGAYSSTCDSAVPGYTAIVDTLRAAGIATVIASGNSALNGGTSFPGCISSAITVGASYDFDAVPTFSNSASWVDLLAPGVSVQSSVTSGGFGFKSGTSMAAPHVAGTWALLKSANPQATVNAVAAALASTGKPVTDSKSGITTPRVRAHAALDVVQASPPPQILTASMPSGFAGVFYSQAIPVQGGAAPLSFQLVSGSLAPGLSGPGSANGVISGTPSTTGVFGPFRIRVTDNVGRIDEENITHAIGLWPPTPLAPQGPTNDTTPIFVWTAVAGATSYRLAVENLTDGATAIDQSGIAGTSFTPTTPLPANKSYRFRVQAQAGSITSVLSSHLDFQTDTIAPAAVSSLAGSVSLGATPMSGLAAIAASGELAPHVKERTVDGNLATLWSTPPRPVSQPEHITFDLGQEAVVSRIRLRSRDTLGSLLPRSFEIQLSLDNASFTTVRTVTGFQAPNSPAAWYAFDLTPRLGRFLKILVTEATRHTDGNHYVQIMEVEAYQAVLSSPAALLTWTATGDDGGIGQASSYDLRYRLSPINDDADFNAAIQASGESSPGPAGSPESFLISGMPGEATVYFALKAADPAGNLSALSNVAAVAVPPIPPSPITNLAATNVAASSVELTWTATGDDGSSGTASLYDLRFSTSLLNGASFQAATPVLAVPTPGPAGSAEAFTVTGLENDKTYYFALRALDEAGNASALSNVVSASTLDDVPPAAIQDLAASAGIVLSRRGVTVAGVSGELPPHVASRTVDGDLNSLWSTPGRPVMQDEYLTFDLGAIVDVGKIRLRSRDQLGNLMPRDFQIQLSSDNVSFVPVHAVNDFSAPVSPALWFDFAFPPASGRYLKLHVTGTNAVAGAYYVQVVEAEVYEAVPQSDRAFLTWTATGDSGSAGSAARYDLRWQTSPISGNADFNAAVQVSGVPLPAAAGAPESFTALGLPAESTVHFAIRAVDDAGNVSALSNPASMVTAPIPPSRVTSLAAGSPTAQSIRLSWLATGDDRMVGVASSYDIRFRTAPIVSDADFAAATSVGAAPAPLPPGTAQSMTVPGLAPETTYYFAMKVLDDAGGISPLSNVASATTLDNVLPSAITDLIASPGVTLAPRAVTAIAASGELSPHVMGRAADGDLTTLWSTPGRAVMQSEYLTFDLGATIGVGRVRLRSREFLGQLLPRDFQIQLSDDNVNFTTARTVQDLTPPSSPAAWYGFDFQPATGRYLRLWITETVPVSGLYYVQISEIEVYEAIAQSDRALLSWTAPGDDGSTGTAASYDVRYSASPVLSETDFASAVPLAGEPPPQPAGSLEVFTASGLPAESTLHFAVKAIDESGNVSPLSNSSSVTTAAVPPAAISSLTATASSASSVELRWTATGDDGLIGTATSYDIRYRTSDILSEADFAAATPVSGAPAPRASGGSESMVLSGVLQADTTYYFAVKAVDDWAAPSPLSNIASAKTLDLVPPATVTDLAVSPGFVLSKRSAVVASASGEISPHGKGRAVDGDVLTLWSTPGRPTMQEEQITLDLGAVHTVARLRLRSRDMLGNLMPRDFDVQVSSDNASFTTVATFLDFAAPVSPAAWYDFDFAPASGRYVRIRVTETNAVGGLFYVQLSEIELYAAVAQGDRLTLRWTAPSDNGMTGTATAYDIRYSRSPITSQADFDAATQVAGEPPPKPPGQSEILTVTGLSPLTAYYFVIQSRDDSGNLSGLSPVASATTGQ